LIPSFLKIAIDGETKLQQVQRHVLSMIFDNLRTIFFYTNASSEESRLSALIFVVRRYRRLKSLFQRATITPTSATIFFELLPSYKTLSLQGLPPTVASMQGNERKGHTTKKE